MMLDAMGLSLQPGDHVAYAAAHGGRWQSRGMLAGVVLEISTTHRNGAKGLAVVAGPTERRHLISREVVRISREAWEAYLKAL